MSEAVANLREQAVAERLGAAGIRMKNRADFYYLVEHKLG